MVLIVRSREETKFLALLAKTQERASNFVPRKRRIRTNNPTEIKNDESTISNEEESGDDDIDWRLPKFVETLEEWLDDLKHHPQGPDKDVLKEYSTKVDFLRKVLVSLTSESQNNLAPDILIDGLAPGSRRNSAIKIENAEGRKRSFREESPFPVKHGHVASKVGVPHVVPHGPAATGETITKEIHQRMSGRQELSIREELFGENDHNTSVFRQRRGRNISDGPGDGQNDLDSLLRAHHADQEEVAEEMLSLARALKEQAKVAGTIIQKDTQTLEKSNDLAERNSSRLTVESDRLSEARSQFSCRCWIWLLVGTVSITFISMVWVMKLFRKRKDME